MLQKARAIGVGELLCRTKAPRARTVGELAMPQLSHGGVFHHFSAFCKIQVQDAPTDACQQQANVLVPGIPSSLCIKLLSHTQASAMCKSTNLFLQTLLIPWSQCLVPGQP